MKIEISPLEKGAEKAYGTAVIIDVFRAFSLEAWLFAKGAEKIYTIGNEADAYALKEKYPQAVLIGERHGKILPGFDFGNSPSSLGCYDFSGKTILHTTTNGTQGIAAAAHAKHILVVSLVNAKATAAMAKSWQEDITIVPMGWEGRETEEDQLCADYLKALLENRKFPDLKKQAEDLRYSEGKKFFDPKQQDVFPEGDFAMCIEPDIFDFAMEVKQEGKWLVCRKKSVSSLI